MNSEEQEFIRRFFRAVIDRPIEFDGRDDQRYVRLYDGPDFEEHDPVKLLARSITLMPGQSVQLLSGLRGSGKSTELRRLRKNLEGLGTYKVALLDIEDYLSPSQPIDVSDFLMALAGGLGDALLEAGHLNGDPVQESYWTRLVHFLARAHIQVTEASGEVSAGRSSPDKSLTAGASANFKASLKSDPSFRQTLQERMAGHLGALVKDVREYVAHCVKKVKARYGPDTEVVLLLDSMEHLRGTLTNASTVQASVVNLFGKHSDKLHFNLLHAVYMVPPYLKILQPNLGSFYQPGGMQMIPTLKVRQRGGERTPFQPALDLLEKMISERGDWKKLLGAGARGTVDELSLLSGGHLRDFLRLFAEILRRADRLPVPEHVVKAAIQQLRSEFMPIHNEDAIWLDHVASTGTIVLWNNKRLHDLIQYFDACLLLAYRNGSEWYDVHPLVREITASRAAYRALADEQASVRALSLSLPLPGHEDTAPAPTVSGIDRLEIHGIQSGPDVRFTLAPRLNLLAGDNSTGKTLVLEVLWWALTGTWWSGEQVWPGVPSNEVEPLIRIGVEPWVDVSSHFDAVREQWVRPAQWPTTRALVLYARIDGSCCVWDPIRSPQAAQGRTGTPHSDQFTPKDLWQGLKTGESTVLNGLLRDWVDWQHRRKELFEQFQRVLEGLSPQDEALAPGAPVRVSIHEALDIPTLAMSYGQVPIIYASAAVKRVLGLAYLLVWAWHEHQQAVRLTGQERVDRIILLIDEAEAHLHPKWQRLILPALVRVIEGFSESLQVQLVSSTHSPLVMASLEPFFDTDQDKVFRFELEAGRISVHEFPWAPQGDVVNWLVSEAFGLKQARSRQAEEAIEAAEAFMREEPLPGFEERETIEQRLKEVLPGHDPFWPRWLVETGSVR